MAIKPNDSDVFLREVDEELRRERMNRFMTRYGWAIIAGIVLFLGAIGGWIWWQNRQQQQAAAEGETLVGALESLEAGNAKAAEPEIARLAESDREGYRLAALFTRANMQIQSGNRAAAVATLKSIAGDEDAAEPYRQAALVRQTTLEFDALQPQVVIQRLGALARPGQPWFGSAGELVAVAYLKMGQQQRAGQGKGKGSANAAHGDGPDGVGPDSSTAPAPAQAQQATKP